MDFAGEKVDEFTDMAGEKIGEFKDDVGEAINRNAEAMNPFS